MHTVVSVQLVKHNSDPWGIILKTEHRRDILFTAFASLGRSKLCLADYEISCCMYMQADDDCPHSSFK